MKVRRLNNDAVFMLLTIERTIVSGVANGGHVHGLADTRIWFLLTYYPLLDVLYPPSASRSILYCHTFRLRGVGR